MQLTPSQRLERAHVSLIRDNDYMWLAGIIPMGKNTVVDDPNMTARTDGLDSEYGMQFIEKLTDAELMDRLKHEASAWFNNQSLLLLEELFRRYRKCQSSLTTNPTPSPSSA